MWGGLSYGPTFYDEAIAQRFTPSSSMQEVIDRLSLTSKGKRILYASQPQLQDKTAFNESCNSRERSAAILGCYYMRRIYVYNIENTELTDAKPVTTAHEMLHAAYERLSASERDRVDAMIERQYTRIKDEPIIQSMVSYYEKAEPGERLNELHSIIGTQVGDLTSELEAYYGTYFVDRQTIVAMSDKYQAVFDTVNNEATQLQETINAEKASLQTDMAQYQVDMTTLNEEIRQFNSRAQAGEFSSEAAFNLARANVISQQTALETRRVALNQRVQAYNDNIARLNTLAVRAQELNKSINGIEQSEGQISW